MSGCVSVSLSHTHSVFKFLLVTMVTFSMFGREPTAFIPLLQNHLKTEQTRKDWSIRLITSSPESALVVINNLNEYIMRAFYINQTPLDNTCVSALSEILKTNRTVKRIYFISSPLIKPLTDAFCINRSIDRLEIELYLQNTSLEDDIMTICHTLTTNKTIERLVLSKKYKESCEKTKEIIQDRLLFL